MKKNICILLCCIALGNMPAGAQNTRAETVETSDLYRQQRTYNSDNNMIEICYQYKKGDMWKNESRQTGITYDAQKRVTQTTYQYPNANNNIEWDNHTRVFTTYDTAGNIIEVHDQIWASVPPNSYGWVNYTRITHAFNAGKIDTCEVHTQWNKEGSLWQNTMRILRNDTCVLYQTWRGTHWEDDTRTLTTYNSATKERVVKQQHMTTNSGWQDDLQNAPPTHP